VILSTFQTHTATSHPLLVGGLRHSNASLALRETVVFSDADSQLALAWLIQQPGVHEAALLTTCNRTEIALVGLSVPQLEQALWGCFAHFKQFDVSDHPDAVFCLQGAQAERHLFDVAAGLDSLVLGEAQILGQVKEMLRRAQQAGSAGFYLDRLLKAALASGKRVRSETGLCQRDDSLSKAAFRWVQHQVPQWAQRPLAVVGGGKMAEIFLQQLHQWQQQQGLTLDVTLINRSPERSAELHHAFGFAAYGWERLPDALAQCHVVLVATGAPHTLIWQDSFALNPPTRKPLWLIDLAVPRNVAPDVADLPHVTLINTDALVSTREAQHPTQHQLRSAAAALVDHDWRAFRAWHQSLPAQHALAHVRSQFEALRQQELANLGPESTDLLPTLDEFSRTLMNKWLHDPVTRLRQSGFSPEAIDTITQAMALLFDVPCAKPPAPATQPVKPLRLLRLADSPSPSGQRSTQHG
jgi:glutamyl-tRNA reductase